MVCIECGKKSQEGYWNEGDWKRLTVRIEIGSDHYERSGLACPKCCQKQHIAARAEEGGG
jgi:hypothetical protein